VAEKLLDGADVGSGLEQVGGEGVAEGVGADGLGDPGGETGSANGALDDGFVQVVAAALARGSIDVGPGGGEDPLPGPLARRGRILDAKGVGKLDETSARAQVGRMLFADPIEVRAQPGLQGRGSERHAIFSAFAIADDQLLTGEVHLLDAKVKGFQQPQAGTVDEGRTEMLDASHGREESGDLAAPEDDRQALRALGVDDTVEPTDLSIENGLIEEQQRGQCLVLSRRADVALCGERTRSSSRGELTVALVARWPDDWPRIGRANGIDAAGVPSGGVDGWRTR